MGLLPSLSPCLHLEISLLRYGLTFNLAFHTTESTDSTADRRLKKEEVYSSRFDFFPLFFDSSHLKELVPLPRANGRHPVGLTDPLF